MELRLLILVGSPVSPSRDLIPEMLEHTHVKPATMQEETKPRVFLQCFVSMGQNIKYMSLE